MTSAQDDRHLPVPRPSTISLRRVPLLLLVLSMAAGCSLVALADRTVHHVVHPGDHDQAAADRLAGRELRRREERRDRA